MNQDNERTPEQTKPTITLAVAREFTVRIAENRLIEIAGKLCFTQEETLAQLAAATGDHPFFAPKPKRTRGPNKPKALAEQPAAKKGK